MTPSGKINRKALPEVDLYHISSDKRYVAPSTEEEKAVCRIMETVLRTSPIGAEDDFFENGGDSLKAMEFVSLAGDQGIHINLQSCFSCHVCGSTYSVLVSSASIMCKGKALRSIFPFALIGI